MGYSAEVVRRARARLAQAKEDRESENRQHLALAYEKVPRIREIDHELRVTMAKTAQAAFLSGSDGREALLALREQNRGLQQERERLAKENFEEGFLDDTPICTICGGSGYVGSTMCECLRELCRQEQKREVSILSGSRDSFACFDLNYYPDRVDPQYGVSPRTVMELCLLLLLEKRKSAVFRQYRFGKNLPLRLHCQNRGRPGLQRILRDGEPPVYQAGTGTV